MRPKRPRAQRNGRAPGWSVADRQPAVALPGDDAALRTRCPRHACAGLARPSYDGLQLTVAESLAFATRGRWCRLLSASGPDRRGRRGIASSSSNTHPYWSGRS